MNITLVKVFGEEDNNGGHKEFFRVYKLESLLMEPQLNAKLILEKGSFYIEEIEQNLQKCVIYLYEFNWLDKHQHWGHKEEFDKIKNKLIEEGWSELDKHKIIRGGI